MLCINIDKFLSFLIRKLIRINNPQMHVNQLVYTDKKTAIKGE